MYAVIETGGKQYRVTEGDVLRVEKLDAQLGDLVVLDKVLTIGFGDDLACGKPYLEEKVFAKLLANEKAEKVIVYKYKSKKNYHKKRGHRQPYSLIEITQIGGEAPKEAKSADKAEDQLEPEIKAQVEGAKKAAEAAEAVEATSADDSAVSMNMKKDELLSYAEEHGVEVNSKMKKQEIIDAIQEQVK